MYAYLSREWGLRVVFGLEVQFSCWSKYWSSGWSYENSFHCWTGFLLSFRWIFNPQDVNVWDCFPLCCFPSARFPTPAVAAPSVKWCWTLVSVCLFHWRGRGAGAAVLGVSTLLVLEMPKERQAWKCLPFIFIWYLVLVPNTNGSWILFPSQYWTQMSFIGGTFLSKHCLSGLFNI